MMKDNQISHEPELYLDLVVFGADGNQKSSYHARSESFMYNWILNLYASTANSLSAYPGLDTSGVSQSWDGARCFYLYASQLPQADSVSPTQTWGIVLGTGSVAVAINDYRLGGVCTHGTGLSQLLYKGMWVDTAVASATGSSVVLNRQISNASLASITITEAGMIFTNNQVAAPVHNWLAVRDLLSIPIILGVDEALLVRYTYLVRV